MKLSVAKTRRLLTLHSPYCLCSYYSLPWHYCPCNCRFHTHTMKIGPSHTPSDGQEVDTKSSPGWLPIVIGVALGVLLLGAIIYLVYAVRTKKLQATPVAPSSVAGVCVCVCVHVCVCVCLWMPVSVSEREREGKEGGRERQRARIRVRIRMISNYTRHRKHT